MAIYVIGLTMPYTKKTDTKSGEKYGGSKGQH